VQGAGARKGSGLGASLFDHPLLAVPDLAWGLGFGPIPRTQNPSGPIPRTLNPSGVGFGVWGSELGVRGSGRGGWGWGWGSEFRVQGEGCRVEGSFTCARVG